MLLSLGGDDLLEAYTERKIAQQILY